MITTRAKFRCGSETRTSPQPDAARTYEFNALYDPEVPEDERYSKYTPSGSLKITVDNPNVQFKLGAQYYLDFIEVEESA